MFNASTRRAIRTGFDMVMGALAVLLIVIPSLGQFGVSVDDSAAILGMVVTATAVLSKVRNLLEDLGVIPAILKDEPTDS